MLLYNSSIQIIYNQRQWDGLRELRAKNNRNSIIWFLFRVTSVLITICFIYYVYGAHDLYKIYIYIINTVLKINQLIFTTTIAYYMIPHQCYGPYKQDSTSTKRRLVLGQDQCTGYGTDKTSKTIGQGVAESHNYARTKYTYILTYLYTKRTDVPTYRILLQRSLYI